MSNNKQSIKFYKSLAMNVTYVKILKFNNDNTHHDIYPAKENKWKDTHFYALICEKLA